MGTVGASTGDSNLFGKDLDIIKISVQTDFNKLLGEKRFHSLKENFLAGKIKYQNHSFQVKVNTSGNTRLGCDLPPLKIRFSEKEVRGTIFDGNSKVKLITHCHKYRTGKYLNEKVYREYRLYKRFEKKSKFHFKTQLVLIDYIDSDDSHLFQTTAFLGFLIEGDKSVEKRTQTKEVKFNSVGWSIDNYPNLSLDEKQLRKTKWFNWMIGNHDYGISSQEDNGRLSRKNIKVFIRDSIGYVIPYDFDRASAVFKNKYKIYKHKFQKWSKILYED